MTEGRNIKLLVEYDGTDYHGWQVQQNARTVQGELIRALAVITGSRISVTGASRTDAGVHAKGQVCNFRTTSRIPANRFPAAINSNLPPGIVVLQAEEAALSFHSRIDAVGKLYSYHISTRQVPLALNRNYWLHYPRAIDVILMQQASEYLVGDHDFAAFQATGSSVKDTARTIWNLDISEEGPEQLRISVSGNGFLYNMVRIMVGTLLLVGTGKLPPEQIKTILAARDRGLAGATAPAHGLCLEKVYYRDGLGLP
jgi:tRNA pseudouridine38-40 synthase